MQSPDPANLQNLNDIILPAPVSWWPLAIGWYFAAALLLVAVVWFVHRSLQKWEENRYRRGALEELRTLTEEVLSTSGCDDSLVQLPILLKRTALAAYPRHRIAALSGKEWHTFLNSKTRTPLFTDAVARTLDIVSYATTNLSTVDAHAVTTLLNASQHWIKHHQPEQLPEGNGER